MCEASLMRGSKQILEALAGLKIIRVALSNTPLSELCHILSEQRLEPELDIIRGGGNWPKIESLKKLLHEFKFPSGNCVFIGDGKGDLWAARAASVQFVAIDPDTGEFEGEQGFYGPFRTLEKWGQKAGLI